MRRQTVLLMVAVVGLWWASVQAQGIPVIDVSNLLQNTATALSTFKTVLNQITELTGWDTLSLDETYKADLDTLGAILKDAQGLSYDLASLNAQVTVLFDLNSAPKSASGLSKRLQDIRVVVVQSYIYALRTQTLIKTTVSTLQHLTKLIADINKMLGNKEGHQTASQYSATLAKTLNTLQAQTSAYERAQSVERLAEPITMESIRLINNELMSDWPQ